jgi:hypothetical protein
MNMLCAILLMLNTIAPAAEPRCVIPGTPTQEMARATAVFSGKVIAREYVSEETSSGEPSQRLVVRIAVERVWKGDIYVEETMFTTEVRLPNGLTGVMAEDFFFEDDKQYLIYALGKRDHLSTDACTRSRELSKADADLSEFGSGYEPKIRN